MNNTSAQPAESRVAGVHVNAQGRIGIELQCEGGSISLLPDLDTAEALAVLRQLPRNPDAGITAHSWSERLRVRAQRNAERLAAASNLPLLQSDNHRKGLTS